MSKNQQITAVKQQLKTLEEFQALKAEFDQRTEAIRREFEEKSSAVTTQLASAVNTYNTVVRNTVNKFSSDTELHQQVLNLTLLPSDAKLVKFNSFSGDYVFVSVLPGNVGKEYKVSHVFLRNDPMAVAQHVRRIIRQQQRINRQRERQNAHDAMTRDKKAFDVAKKNLEKTTAEYDVLARAAERRVEKQTARKLKKTAART